MAIAILLLCGAGGIRTLVQTVKPCAFYMLILDFIFVLRQDPSHQPQPYPRKISQEHRGTTPAIPDISAPL